MNKCARQINETQIRLIRLKEEDDRLNATSFMFT